MRKYNAKKTSKLQKNKKRNSLRKKHIKKGGIGFFSGYFNKKDNGNQENTQPIIQNTDIKNGPKKQGTFFAKDRAFEEKTLGKNFDGIAYDSTIKILGPQRTKTEKLFEDDKIQDMIEAKKINKERQNNISELVDNSKSFLDSIDDNIDDIPDSPYKRPPQDHDDDDVDYDYKIPIPMPNKPIPIPEYKRGTEKQFNYLKSKGDYFKTLGSRDLSNPKEVDYENKFIETCKNNLDSKYQLSAEKFDDGTYSNYFLLLNKYSKLPVTDDKNNRIYVNKSNPIYYRVKDYSNGTFIPRNGVFKADFDKNEIEESETCLYNVHQKKNKYYFFGGKTHKRKTHKRKTHKRKTYKQKTHKRKI
jgi:hypothetical protein